MATGYNRFTTRSYWDVFCYPCNKVMEFSTPPRPLAWDGWEITDWSDIEGHHPLNVLSTFGRGVVDVPLQETCFNESELPKEQSETAKQWNKDHEAKKARHKSSLTFRPRKSAMQRNKGQI